METKTNSCKGVLIATPSQGLILSPYKNVLVAPDKLEKVEQSIVGADIEYGYIFDAKSNIQNIVKGDRNSLSLKHLKVEETRGCVFTHNHPSGGAPSSDDVFNSHYYEFQEFRAVCNKQIYRLFPSGGYNKAIEILEVTNSRVIAREMREFVRNVMSNAYGENEKNVLCSIEFFRRLAIRCEVRFEICDRLVST